MITRLGPTYSELHVSYPISNRLPKTASAASKVALQSVGSSEKAFGNNPDVNHRVAKTALVNVDTTGFGLIVGVVLVLLFLYYSSK